LVDDFNLASKKPKSKYNAKTTRAMYLLKIVFFLLGKNPYFMALSSMDPNGTNLLLALLSLSLLPIN